MRRGQELRRRGQRDLLPWESARFCGSGPFNAFRYFAPPTALHEILSRYPRRSHAVTTSVGVSAPRNHGHAVAVADFNGLQVESRANNELRSSQNAGALRFQHREPCRLQSECDPARICVSGERITSTASGTVIVTSSVANSPALNRVCKRHCLFHRNSPATTAVSDCLDALQHFCFIHSSSLRVFTSL